MKEILLRIRDAVVSKSRIVFPVLLIAIVAATVSIALGMKKNEGQSPETVQAAPMVLSDTDDEAASADGAGNPGGKLVVPEVPLETDFDPAIRTLILTYYDALANGNADTIGSISSYMSDMERIKIQELGKYIDLYPVVDIYTKPGPEENSYVVFAYTKATFSGYEEQVAGFQTFYVCTNADGSFYLNEDEIPQEYIDYIYEICFQEDVVELYNKATVEYNETMAANKDLFQYIAAMDSDIYTTVGLIIASQEAQSAEPSQEDGQAGSEGGESTPEDGQAGSEGGESTPEGGQTGNDAAPQEPTGPAYATATATVNVRKSDSETADKLGKVSKGTRLQVLEQRPNGWSKVEYEGKEGYIKSDYLHVAESAAGVQVIGKVTATTGINIRSTPGEDGERMGILASGESLDLVEVLDGWCKVIYNGQIAYVKAEYVVQG